MGILWSLAVEEHFYLLFPPLYCWFVVRSVSRKRQVGYLLGLCFAVLLWRICRAAWFHSPWENIYEGTDTRFDSILFGCVLAVAANPRLGDDVQWLRHHARSLALAGTLLILFSFAYRNPFFRDTFRYSLLGIGLAPIFFLISLPERHLVTRFLEFLPLRWMGQLSYTMYLIHHALFHHFYHSDRPIILLAVGIFLITVCYAQAMRSLVEVPLQAMRRRLRSPAAGTTARLENIQLQNLSPAQKRIGPSPVPAPSPLSIVRGPL